MKNIPTKHWRTAVGDLRLDLEVAPDPSWDYPGMLDDLLDEVERLRRLVPTEGAEVEAKGGGLTECVKDIVLKIFTDPSPEMSEAFGQLAEHAMDAGHLRRVAEVLVEQALDDYDFPKGLTQLRMVDAKVWKLLGSLKVD